MIGLVWFFFIFYFFDRYYTQETDIEGRLVLHSYNTEGSGNCRAFSSTRNVFFLFQIFIKGLFFFMPNNVHKYNQRRGRLLPNALI